MLNCSFLSSFAKLETRSARKPDKSVEDCHSISRCLLPYLSDAFHQDGEEANIKLHEKGDKRRAISIHFAAAEAIQEYIQKAGLTSGSLFRPRKGSRTEELADRALNPVSMYLLIQSYLERLPNSHKEIAVDGEKRKVCVYTPHSLRATAATLLLDAGVDIRKVQELLGHRHITTTQIYDKRRRTTAESASHDMPI